MLKTPRAIHQFLHGKSFAWYTYEKFAFLCDFCSPLSFLEMTSLHQFLFVSCKLYLSRFYCQILADELCGISCNKVTKISKLRCQTRLTAL